MTIYSSSINYIICSKLSHRVSMTVDDSGTSIAWLNILEITRNLNTIIKLLLLVCISHRVFSFSIIGTMFLVSWSPYPACVWLGHTLPPYLWAILPPRQVEMFWSSEENHQLLAFNRNDNSILAMKGWKNSVLCRHTLFFV